MYGNSPYAYANNPGYGFLDNNMQRSLQPNLNMGLGSNFNKVMAGLSAGVATNASMGIVPNNAGQTNFTPQQVAAQMNFGGPMSALPYLGNSTIPKLIFPAAGLWSMYDGVKAMRRYRWELDNEPRVNMDPTQLNYNKTLNQMNIMNEYYSQLGPFN